jgi:hypothetical protein
MIGFTKGCTNLRQGPYASASASPEEETKRVAGSPERILSKCIWNLKASPIPCPETHIHRLILKPLLVSVGSGQFVITDL